MGSVLRLICGAAVVVGAFLVAPAPLTAGPKAPVQKKAKDFVGRSDQKRDGSGVYRFESGAYRIFTDVDKNLANDIAAHMDEVYKVYSEKMAHFKPNPYSAVKPNEKMPLYVRRRYKDYVELLAGFGIRGENSGGVFFRTADKQSGLATWVEGQSRLKMYYVLQHEGFHQFADARIMFGMPPWVNEGLAEYFGDAVMVDNKLIVGRLDRERIDRMRRAVKEGQTLPFRELMTMNNDRWVRRVVSGDKAGSLMYDSAWSVCYYLIHGGKGGRQLITTIDGSRGGALEGYLLLLNQNFIKNPQRDPAPDAFTKVFSNNLAEFEKQWKLGLEQLEPDPWFTSVRHLQFVAAALKQFHAKNIEVKSWPHLKEQLIRHKFRATIRERDVVNRGERKEQVEDVEQAFDFPDPAEVEFLPSDDPKLPAGLLITNVTPNIRLTWSLNAAGKIEENISCETPPKIARKAVAKKSPPVIGQAKLEAPAKASGERNQTQP
jgi:hypothetical protein